MVIDSEAGAGNVCERYVRQRTGHDIWAVYEFKVLHKGTEPEACLIAAGLSRADAELLARADAYRAAVSLLERLRQWDHLGSSADGPYWQDAIDAALAAVRGQQ